MSGEDSSAGRSLMTAASSGNVEEVHRLIKGEVLVNAVDQEGRTPLIRVAQKWNCMPGLTVGFLINLGTDVNIKDKKGNTALMYAIDNRDEETAIAIIKNSKDLDLNAINNQGETALMKAAINRGMANVALALINRGADVNIKDKKGNTALMYAIDNRNEETALAIIKNSKDLYLNAFNNLLMKSRILRMDRVVLALTKCGTDVNVKNTKGNSALMYAIAQGNKDTALAIIENSKDLDLNAIDNRGKTALMYAIDKRNKDTALAIIENFKDLDLNAVDNQGETALMKAAAIDRGMANVALALIKCGADVNIKNKEGNTALMYAIAQGNEETALAIIKNSKDLGLNAIDNQGETALMTAAAIDREMANVALALIKCGADVNVKNTKGNTALMYAIAQGNKDTALAIIKNSKDLDLNAVDNRGETLLMKAAAIFGMLNVVPALIVCGVDVNVTNNDGSTALMYAIAQGTEDTALAIIENSKNLELNSVDNREQTALMKAAILGINSVVIALIKCGADVNMKDKESKTALMYAIAQGTEDTPLAIIENSKDLDLNAIDNTGQTALMKAAINGGMIKVALALINCGADVNMKNTEGNTALMCAIAQGNDESALAIIENSKYLDLDAIDNQGQTSLMKAIFRMVEFVHKQITCDSQGRIVLKKADINEEMVKVAFELIKCGADANMKDKERKTALMYAIDKRNEETALAIIQHSKDLELNCVDNQGQTALMKAADNRMINIALALINCGADANMKNTEGNTALMYAIAQGNEDTALAIIENSKDLDLNAINNRGETALMKAAAFFGMVKVVPALINRGADVNVKNKEGNTALMYAIEEKNRDRAIAIIEESKDLDLNAVDDQGQTALFKATVNGMTETAVALVTNGADVNMTNKEGKTALMFSGSTDVISGKGTFDFPDSCPLTLALIDAGADVNKTDEKGNTALMYNVKYSASLEALIRHGNASVDKKNKLGRTALFYAFSNEAHFSEKLLLSRGANIHLIDNYKVSVLSYFIHHCINEGLELILPCEFDLFEENGMNKEAVVKSIVKAVFCKLPLAVYSNHNNIKVNAGILTMLNYASYLSKKRFGIRKDTKCRLFNDLATMLERPNQNITIDDLSVALGKLLQLGTDPNILDEQGNAISHYIVLLGLYDSSINAESILNVFRFLNKEGLRINEKNCNNETPLFFMLSNAINHVERNLAKEFLVNMSKFFIQIDPTLTAKETSPHGESVFHLIIQLSEAGGIEDECVLELLQIFANSIEKLGVIINRSDDEMNTPVHIWAASPPRLESGQVDWLGPSNKILDFLVRCGAVLHTKNKKGESALHVCRTWTAVKLLAKVGTKPGDVDLTGRSPLLAAAQNSLFLLNPGCFYPDVSSSESPTFWKTAMDMGFDLWTCDKDGDSVLCNLLRENSFELGDSMIACACGHIENMTDEDLVGILSAICKNVFSQTTRKRDLVGRVLKSLRRDLDMSAPLRSCCIGIKNHNASLSANIGESGDDRTESVYEIVKQLIFYCPDSVNSCLDVAEGCPALQDLLSTPVCTADVPLVIQWTPVSKRYKSILEAVARRQDCEIQGPYWYHNKHIASGAFGYVFVGIQEKDGMEVAIKKINNLLKEREEDLREIRTFASIHKCDHIVRYLACLEANAFSYIIMELMEGNLAEYFTSAFYDQTKNKMLCRDVALGLNYLHEKHIIHRDLKPGNVLFRLDPNLRLKIADFGLSLRLDINASFTVMATGVGTRGWVAPEVMRSTAHEHSMSSDVFSLGLILHYILSNKKHPFSPADCSGKSDEEINIATEDNILKNNMEGWINSLDPEACNVVTGMIHADNNERPKVSTVLHHPLFWSKKKKLDFLSAVGNQEEFECPRAKRTVPLSMVEQDLENEFTTIVKFGKWDDPRYAQTSGIFIEMQKPIVKHDKKGKPYTIPTRKYDIGSAVELVRFIRNAIAHVSDASRPAAIRTQILDDAVVLDEFPHLVIEVFKVVTKHGWDVSKEEIKHVLANN